MAGGGGGGAHNTAELWEREDRHTGIMRVTSRTRKHAFSDKCGKGHLQHITELRREWRGVGGWCTQEGR